MSKKTVKKSIFSYILLALLIFGVIYFFTVLNKKVNDLIPYINNSRTHSEEQVNQIVASINEFGFNEIGGFEKFVEWGLF